MKKANTIIALLLFVLAVVGCRKDKELENIQPKVTDIAVNPSTHQADFSWKVDFVGNYQTGVEISDNDDMSDSRTVEGTKDGAFFGTLVGSLVENTTYYYRILVWNKFDTYSFPSDPSEIQHFTTGGLDPDTPQDTTYYDITVSANPPEGGTATGGGRYAEGDTCTVTATPNEGFIFVNWTEEGNPVADSTEYSFEVTGRRDLVANFVEESAVLYTVTTKAEPTEGGEVFGGGTYEEGAEIELRATPNLGYSFDRWQDGNRDNPRTVTVTADTTYTAYFTQDEYEITVQCQPADGGTASVNGLTFHYGEMATLTATANDGYDFAGWSDGNTANPREVTVTGNATYTAVFSEAGAVYYNVIVHVEPEDAGTVTGGGPHEAGSQIELNAMPEEGYHFDKWGDGNTNNPRRITVNADMEFTVLFKKNTYTVTVSAGTGGTAHVGDIVGTIEATFEHGDICMVHATADAGYTFANWTESGAVVSASADYDFEVTDNRNLVANFTQETYTITVNAGTGGHATGGGTFHYGETATLTATADECYQFESWNDGNTDSLYVVTVTGDATYTASFSKKEYTITVTHGTGGTAHVGSSTGPTSQDVDCGANCTIYAVANEHYEFDNWTEGSTVVSSNATHTVNIVTESHTFKANFKPKQYTVTVTHTPSAGGTATISGGGTTGSYTYNQQCTVVATLATGYHFLGWYKSGTRVWQELSYTFSVEESCTLEARFEINTYTITVIANPANGGTVQINNGTAGSTATGNFAHGTTIQLKATANSGYNFSQWSDGGAQTHNVTVTADATYTATFTAQPQAPTGALPGKFTINANGDKVYFSKGNLQYNKTTNEWSFMEHQYDIVETLNQNVGENYANQNIISLFGWGTSGYNDSSDSYNVNYQPWSTSAATVNETYNNFGYGPSTNMPSPNLTGSSANYDWGVYNPISNGGSQSGQWRTLTGWTDNNDTGEWDYVFNGRTTSSGILYAKAQVNGVNGVILLPDDWSASYYSLSSTNAPGAGYTSNTITDTQWNTLEQHGAVFLPAAGFRSGSSVNSVGSIGGYWSASYYYSSSARSVYFGGAGLSTNDGNYRYVGRSVRLVCPAEN